MRGSVFRALAAPVADDDEARELLAKRQRVLWNATHHCSAWRLRSGVQRANDAGEPSGSAGAPILAAIAGAGLEDCAVVVTRDYGGTKLGVGGLIRAYGDAAGLALQAAPRRTGIPAVQVRIRYKYDYTAAVMRVLAVVEAQEMQHGYTAEGLGELECIVPRARETTLRELLRQGTAGALTPEVVGERILYRAEASAP